MVLGRKAKLFFQASRALKEKQSFSLSALDPNASTLWNLVKENLRNINFMGNKINLVDITEDDFISSIEEIYNERKNI